MQIETYHSSPIQMAKSKKCDDAQCYIVKEWSTDVCLGWWKVVDIYTKVIMTTLFNYKNMLEKNVSHWPLVN